MMKLVNSKGNVQMEREKPSTTQARMTSVRTRRLTKGLKKTVRPVLMSKEEFFNNFLHPTANGNV